MGFDKEKRFESVYSQKVKAGKRRTYFFDVRKTKGSDYFITITESTRRFEDDSYVRHKIFLYKEDFNRFLGGLTEVVNHVKTDLMPDYNYDEFERRYDEDDDYEDQPEENRPPKQEHTAAPEEEREENNDVSSW